MFERLFSQSGLSLDRLRSLVEVEVAGGIAAAAPNDLVRQSQLSRNLAQLETFFGVELKRRSGRGIELTAEGIRLASLAREYLKGLEGFLDEAEDGLGEIRIGGGHSTLEWIVLPHLPRNLNSTAGVILHSRRSHEVVSGLLDFSLDFGVLRKSAITSSRLLQVPLVSHSYSLFASKRIIKQTSGNPLRIIGDFPLALSMGGESRRQFEDWCRNHDLVPSVGFSGSSFRLVLEILKQRDGIVAFLPDSLASEAIEAGCGQVSLPDFENGQRELVFAWHQRLDSLRPGLQAWRESFLAGNA